VGVGAAGSPRGRRPAGLLAAAGAALVTGAVVLAIALIGGEDGFRYGNPFDPFPSGGKPGTGQEVSGAPDPERDLTRFVTFVANDVQGFWQREFEGGGQIYEPAQVIAFRSVVSSGCGVASAETGPFYCPADRRIYFDLSFFRELAQRFDAPGDFAQAYVIAHEFGHHVQNVTGIFAQVGQATADGTAPPNELSILVELQADCLAGVWGHSTYERGLLERGDLDEGLRAASAVGDDRIQTTTTGQINPETWTHGSSDQRRAWFLRGFQGGDPNDCDTFSPGA
jgi:predicted metalloprotease